MPQPEDKFQMKGGEIDYEKKDELNIWIGNAGGDIRRRYASMGFRMFCSVYRLPLQYHRRGRCYLCR